MEQSRNCPSVFYLGRLCLSSLCPETRGTRAFAPAATVPFTVSSSLASSALSVGHREQRENAGTAPRSLVDPGLAVVLCNKKREHTSTPSSQN